MLENIPDHRHIFDEADDHHGIFTFRTNQRVHFIYFMNQSCPSFSESLHITLRFKDTRDSLVVVFFLPFSSCDVAVITIVPDHLFALVRDVRTHHGQLFQNGEALVCFLSPERCSAQALAV